MKTHEERQFGRAKNAVLFFLEKRLSVPKIYIDAEWASAHIDVLAIDRDGVGDVHAVLIFGSRLLVDPEHLEDSIDDVNNSLVPLIERLLSVPAQYKYIAAVNLGGKGVDPLPGIPNAAMELSYDPNGIGRIGYMAVDIFGEDDPRTRFVLKPERFRAKVADLADDYVGSNNADWEIRA